MPSLVYTFRRWLFQRKPDLAVHLFASFNCLVLARGASTGGPRTGSVR